MSKRFSKPLVALIVAVLGVTCWLLVRPGEPSWQGKPLGYWIDPSARKGQETAATRSAALAALRDKAVPHLVRQLDWKPSPSLRWLHHQFPNFPPFIRYEQGGSDPRPQAAYALGEFGPLATNAIPALRRASTASDLGSSWYPRMCARAALLKIEQAPLAPFIEKLKDTSWSKPSALNEWYENALMLGQFGTNAADAVPNLLLALGPTNHSVIQSHALLALGEIHSHPDVCVPAIIPFLTAPDISLRSKSVYALTEFGEAARPAWTNLFQCLQDPNAWIRMSAATALRAIDPAGAAKAGVK